MSADIGSKSPETEAWRRAFAALSEDAVATPACPPADSLWKGARGALAPGALRDLIEHTATCAACAESWRLAAELEAAAGTSGAARPASLGGRRPGWWRSRRAGALAAAAVLALVVGWQGRDLLGPAPEATFRGANSAPAVRSLVGASLPRQDFVLRWQGPQGARYGLLVMTEELTEIVEVDDLGASEYRVPEEALAGLDAGTRILWQVVAGVGESTPRAADFEVRLE